MRIDDKISQLEKDIEEYKIIQTKQITLDICKILFDDFIAGKKDTLHEMKNYRMKKFIPAFEMTSAECNIGIDKIIEISKKYLGQEPKSITDEMNEIINEYAATPQDIDQEKKNDIYLRLKQHIDFLTKTYKK